MERNSEVVILQTPQQREVSADRIVAEADLKRFERDYWRENKMWYHIYDELGT